MNNRVGIVWLPMVYATYGSCWIELSLREQFEESVEHSHFIDSSALLMKIGEYYRRHLIEEALRIKASKEVGEIAIEIDSVCGRFDVIRGWHDEEVNIWVCGGYQVCWDIDFRAL